MTNNTANKVYQQLISQQEDEILQGIRQAQKQELLDELAIRTALICLGYFRSKLVNRAFAKGFEKPDYLVKIKKRSLGDVSTAFTDLLNYVVGNPKITVDIDTVKLFVARHCQKVESLHFSHQNIVHVPNDLLSPQTLPSLAALSFERIKTLPAFVFSFKALKRLCFKAGKLNHFPKTLTQLHQLKALNLSDNKLEQLPDALAQLRYLEVLNVSGNRLKQLPNTLTTLEQLTELNVSDNALTELPQDMGVLTKLKRLEVGYNYLLSLPQGLGSPQLTLKGWANPYVKLSKGEAKVLAADYQYCQRNATHSPRYSARQRNVYALFLYAFGRQHQLNFKAKHELERWLKMPKEYKIFEKLLQFHNIIPHLPRGYDQDFLRKLLTHYVEETNQATPFEKLKMLFADFSCFTHHIKKPQFKEILTAHPTNDLVKYIRVTEGTNDPDLLKHLTNTDNITRIDLSNRGLSEFPEWLLNYTQLTHLDLSSNQMEEVPLAKLRFEQLKQLNLSENKLKRLLTDGANPWHLPALHRLNLNNNLLQQLPQNDWDKLPNLKYLMLEHNQLQYLPDALTELPHLKKLQVSYNNLAQIPEVLSQRGVVHIKDFIYNYCYIPTSLKQACLLHLKRQQIQSAKAFTNFFCITLFHDDEEFRNAILEQIRHLLLPREQALLDIWEYRPKPDYIELLFFLSKVRSTFEPYLEWEGIEAWISRLTLHSTKRVLLSGLGLTSLPDFTLKYWQNPWVDLSHNELNQMPTTLGHIFNLSRLDLSHNLLTQLNNDDVMLISQVKNLNLSYNFLVQVPLYLFVEPPRLVNLDLSHNCLTELPNAMRLPKLKKLDLSHNLFAQISASVTQLPQIQHIDLSYNHLGLDETMLALPLEISYLDRLTHLDLSYNFLSVLPLGIGLSERLQWLNLSHNRLAEVPVGLYDSLTLEVLDLSYNRLEQLPNDLAEVTTLQQLILTGNPLPQEELQRMQSELPNTTIIFEKKPTTEVFVESIDQVSLQAAQELCAQAEAHWQQNETQRGLVCLRAAAFNGYLTAMEQLAEHYYQHYQLAKARHWYGKAAAQGSNRAAKTYEQLFGLKLK